MCPCPKADVTGWTLDYVQSCAQEDRVCIISKLTILRRVLMTNYLMSCCRYLRIPLMRIKRSLRPIWPTAPPITLKSASIESDVQPKVPDIPAASPGAGTAPSFKRGRGRPPKAQKKRLVQAKARTRKKESPTNAETEASAETAVQAETENLKSAEASEAPRYQLRSKRQPRYKCGTCGL